MNEGPLGKTPWIVQEFAFHGLQGWQSWKGPLIATLVYW